MSGACFLISLVEPDSWQSQEPATWDVPAEIFTSAGPALATNSPVPVIQFPVHLCL